MDELLRNSEMFQGLSDSEIQCFRAIARNQALRAGEYLFLLGDTADQLYVVITGKVDLCFPMPLRGIVRDISVESIGAGNTLGWSALVKPYRFTLSARVIEPGEALAFTRADLLRFFEGEPRLGYAFYTRISELVGIRLLTMQALWARELRRTLAAESTRDAGMSDGG
jgi:CRP/FNR family cyclic AMP-dependent transcriptional regulator